MTPEHALAFAVALALWALLPGPGLAAVISRTLASGARSGVSVIAGLILADLIFLAVAVAGLFALATTLGPLFQMVKFAGAAYLIWRGIQAFRQAGIPISTDAHASGPAWRDIGLGLLITLGNPKAILFFGALLPLFVDMASISGADFALLAAIVIGTSFLVYGAMILAAERARRLLTSTPAVKRLRQATGALLVGSGVMVATR